MPIIEYRLAIDNYPQAALTALLQQSCRLFAEVLVSPIDRVRAVVIDTRSDATCVGGRMMTEGGSAAPYFTFFLLTGRPESQRQRLLAGFTDLLVECLDVDRDQVRGAVTLVAPEDWAIAGVPASVARDAEIEARKAADGND